MPASILWPVDRLAHCVYWIKKNKTKHILAAQDFWSEHNVARLTTECRLWCTKNTIKDKKTSPQPETKRAARWADLDQTGSPTWSAGGRTGGEQTGPGCPCDERRKQARGGGVLVRQPSRGGYLEAREVKVTFASVQTFIITSSISKLAGTDINSDKKALCSLLTQRSPRIKRSNSLYLKLPLQIVLSPLQSITFTPAWRSFSPYYLLCRAPQDILIAFKPHTNCYIRPSAPCSIPGSTPRFQILTNKVGRKRLGKICCRGCGASGRGGNDIL